jgi:predicted lipoprotein with Yx(FWY)xxD motif
MTITTTRGAFAVAAILLSAAGAQAADMLTAKIGMTLYILDKDFRFRTLE